MANPELTVLIPVYNGARYLAKAIESVLLQSFRDFELLILDDGSTDETPQIMADYAAKDGRIRTLHHANQGVGYTLGRGLRAARGDYIAELGADDIALPERFKQQLLFLKRNRDHVMVGGYLDIIDENDAVIGRREYPVNKLHILNTLPIANPFASPSLMYIRMVALDAGSYTSRFKSCEDYDFVLRLALRGAVANLPFVLTAYRMHPDAEKARNTVRQLRETLSIKCAAYSEYGYPETGRARIINLAQRLLALAPPGLVYALFKALAIRRYRKIRP
ncbi:MAG TPA: glycosyltransferase [Candidatus Tumulicola sp.]